MSDLDLTNKTTRGKIVEVKRVYPFLNVLGVSSVLGMSRDTIAPHWTKLVKECEKRAKEGE